MISKFIYNLEQIFNMNSKNILIISVLAIVLTIIISGCTQPAPSGTTGPPETGEPSGGAPSGGTSSTSKIDYTGDICKNIDTSTLMGGSYKKLCYEDLAIYKDDFSYIEKADNIEGLDGRGVPDIRKKRYKYALENNCEGFEAEARAYYERTVIKEAVVDGAVKTELDKCYRLAAIAKKTFQYVKRSQHHNFMVY
jgi:hypothetical protein